MKKSFPELVSKSTRAVLALLTLALLGGCVSYYERHYDDPGIYYGTGYESAYYPRSAPPPLNPVVYPYWSLDYFYFSRYYHPYSVFVGYSEPLYYPYPGWVFGGRYASHRYGYRPGFRASLGFGYPWYGYGYGYPTFSLGFFASYDRYRGYHDYGYRHDHRLRHIDRRLRALQDPARSPSRSSLVNRERRAASPFDNRINASLRRSASQQTLDAPTSRTMLLRERSGTNAGSVQRGVRAVAPSRSRAGALESRDRIRSERSDTIQRRSPRPPALDRSRSVPDRIQQSSRGRDLRSSRPAPESRPPGVSGRASSTAPNRREVLSSGRASSRPGSAPPPQVRSRSTSPVRAGTAAPRPQSAPPSRSTRPARSANPPRDRVRAERAVPSRSARAPSRSQRADRGPRSDRRRDRPD